MWALVHSWHGKLKSSIISTTPILKRLLGVCLTVAGPSKSHDALNFLIAKGNGEGR